MFNAIGVVGAGLTEPGYSAQVCRIFVALLPGPACVQSGGLHSPYAQRPAGASRRCDVLCPLARHATARRGVPA